MRLNSSTQISLNSYNQLNSSNIKNELHSQNKSRIDSNAVKVNISSSSLNKLEPIDSNLIKHETIINSSIGWDGWNDKRAKAIEIRNEHYSKIIAKDKIFDNPAQYIKDKYYNESSPHFISDLSDEERLGAYKNELGYLKYGSNAPIKYIDPVILKEIGYMHGGLDNVQRKEFQREKVNEQFGQLLDKHNITIPQDIKLRFTIDPYTYKAEVSGTDDLNLAQSIENAINTAENSSQLFSHIYKSKFENNTQITTEKYQKKGLYHDIKNETGYELDKLEVVNGKFVIEDGTDIFEIYKENVKEGTSIPEVFKSVAISGMYEDLENLAEVGFDAVPDLVLSIDYENGSFYDVGQSKNFGTGQTQWIDDFEKKYSAESYRAGYRTPSDSNTSSIKEFDKLTIIRDALQDILNSEEDDDKLIIDSDKPTLDKNELMLKYLFKTWKEENEEDFNALLEELKRDGLIDQTFLSDNTVKRDSKSELINSYWINEVQKVNDLLNVYV